MFDRVKKLLVLAPHVDDMEFGLGGTLAKYASSIETTLVVFFCGDYFRADSKFVTRAQRVEEARAGAAKLGIAGVRVLESYEENSGRGVCFPDLVDDITDIAGRTLPDTVAVCLPSFNQDHTALHEATLTAFRPGRLLNIPRIIAYEYPGNSWGPAVGNAGRVYVPLDRECMAAKQSALVRHRSQSDNRAWPEFVAAEPLAAQRGAEIGAEAAECFWLLREISK